MKIKNFLANAFVSLSAFLLILFVADKVLWGVYYFRDRVPAAIAYPPNFSEKAKFIDHFYTIRTNDKGIRYPKISQNPAPNQKRVVVLGDSFTEGQGVEASQTFSALLENKFSTQDKQTLFINCGIAGSGPTEYEIVLNQIGFIYHPDLVLIVFYANDLDNMQLPEIKSKSPKDPSIAPGGKIKKFLYWVLPSIYRGLRQFYSDYQFSKTSADMISLIAKQAHYAGISDEAISAWRQKVPSEIAKLINDRWVGEELVSVGLLEPDLWVKNLDIKGDEAQKKWPLMLSTIQRMIQTSHMRGAQVAVVYAPHPYQYDARYSKIAQNLGVIVRPQWLVEETAIEQKLKEWANQNEIPFLNLTPYFRQASSGEELLNYHIDQHWNPKGHAVAAQAIGEWLAKIKIVRKD